MGQFEWVRTFAEEFRRLRPNSAALADTVSRNQYPHDSQKDPKEAALAWIKASDALQDESRGGDAG